jgi:hypothetical protein
MVDRKRAGMHALDSHLTISALRLEPAWRVQRGALCRHAAHEMSGLGFDFAPIESDGTGVTHFCSLADLRSSSGSLHVQAVARPLEMNQLLTPTASVRDLRRALIENEFVVIEDTLGGIGVVTHADLAHPVVSSSAFHTLMVLDHGLGAFLELFDDPALLAEESLGVSAIERIEGLMAERRRRNLELSFTRSMTLEDRFDLVVANGELWAQLVDSKNELKKWKKNAQRLRDAVAHGGSLLDIPGDARTALELVGDLELLSAKVWDRVEDAVWTRFAFAEVLATDGAVLAGRGAPANIGADRWVLTADNPGGLIAESSPGAFIAEQERLRQCLMEMGVPFAEGRAGRLRHWEHSFIIKRMGEEQILQLAIDFGQLAVFRLTDKTQILIRASDAAEVRCIPRCR